MNRNKGEKIRKELGAKIKSIRDNKNLTQEEVANKADMSSNYFAKIERGEINATFETLYKIIKALKVEASDIFPS